MSSQHPTPLVVPIPTVLVVGDIPGAMQRLSVILGPTGIRLRETNLMDLRSDSATLRPIVLLVDLGIYDFDPEAFEMVAQDVGAELGVVASAQEAELTVKRLLSAPAQRGDHRPPSPQDNPLSRRFTHNETPKPPSSGEEPTQKWRFTTESLGIDDDPFAAPILSAQGR